MSRGGFTKILKWPWRRKKREEGSGLAPDAASRLTLPRYRIVKEPLVVQSAFERVFQAFEEAMYQRASLAVSYRLEKGRLPQSQSYFFLAPWHQTGYLFEQGPTGWHVSKAEKLESQQTFMRSSESWDQVTLFQSADEGRGPLRLRSLSLGSDIMTFPIYLDVLFRSLRLEPGEL